MVFVTTGGLGIIWVVVWYVAYRDPRDSRRTNAAEIALIRDGGGLVDLGGRHRDRPSVSRRDLRLILGSRKLWGVYFGQYAVSSTLWFFLTWFPTYLVQARGMDITRAGFLASLPFLAAFVGVNSSGLLSDFMVRRGTTLSTARKVPIVAGLLLSTSIVGANYVDAPGLIIAFFAVAFFGNGLSSISWALVSAME